MTYFFTGFLLLAGFLVWGAGLAFLATPRRYRRFAWIFAMPSGVALQSLAVWVGAHSGLAGTNVYGRAALTLPALLALVAWWRLRKDKLHGGRTIFWPVGALMAVQLAVMLLPFAMSGRGLTTVSIGSLDACDYGAGARVFQEFSCNDRTGFMGQAETVSVGVVDNFFDYWLRTNHFTPSALIALNGSILGLKPHELTGLMTIVLLTATLPMVFWLARAGLRYRSWPSLAVTAIYAFSPINWYAVFQVSPAQIVAANAIALLTWCGLAIWREGASWASKWRWAGLLFVGYGLVFGGYNFIIIVALIPAVAVVGGLALAHGLWAKLGRWLVVMLTLLVLSGLFYFERLAGVIERLTLFNHGYGWAIAGLTPEGWLGFISGPWLTGYATGLRVPLAAGVALLVLGAWWLKTRRNREGGWTAVAVALPILAGYGWLQYKALSGGDPTSYQAYKLFAVFYPGLLAAFCAWGDEGWLRGGVKRWAVAGGLAIVFFVNFAGEWRLFYRLIDPPLVVEKETIALSRIEQMPEVGSVNMRLEEGWVRLWANALLLRKNQYFEIHSYEGRGATALKGEWDLLGDFFRYDLPAGDSLHPANGYTLLRRSSPCYLEARLDYGWIETLRDDPRRAPRTRWAADAIAKVMLKNPQPVPLRVSLAMQLRSLNKRDLAIRFGNERLDALNVYAEPQRWAKNNLVLSPGETVVEFSTTYPQDFVGGRSKRPVTFAIDGIDLKVLGRVE
ncbi:MAG: hypothetical protein QM715_21240 [Nibricoccus sp.]